jgi:hypothetical protein
MSAIREVFVYHSQFIDSPVRLATPEDCIPDTGC